MKSDEELDELVSEYDKRKLLSTEDLYDFYHIGYNDAIEDAGDKVVDRAVEKLKEKYPSVPTKEAVPVPLVPKAAWTNIEEEYASDTDLGKIRFMCSRCGMYQEMKTIYPKGLRVFPNYCCNCGADMSLSDPEITLRRKIYGIVTIEDKFDPTKLYSSSKDLCYIDTDCYPKRDVDLKVEW